MSGNICRCGAYPASWQRCNPCVKSGEADMDPFAYVHPRDIDGACRQRSDHMRSSRRRHDARRPYELDVEQPDTVIDLRSMPWTTIEERHDGSVRVGAMVRNAEMARHPLIRQRYVLLPRRSWPASPQLRNMRRRAQFVAADALLLLSRHGAAV